MLDIKYIRDHAEAVKNAAAMKKVNVDIDRLLSLDDERRRLITETEDLRAQRNELARTSGDGKPTPERIEEGKRLKTAIASGETDLAALETEYEELMVRVPTIPATDTPVGPDDSGNVEILHCGEPRQFDFTAKDHIDLGRDLDLIDFERGVKVAGYRGYYVKNEAVTLELGLMLFALHELSARGFTPVIPPTLVKSFALFGSGYFAGRQYDPEKDEIYKVANRDREADGAKTADDRFLIGTAEPSLLAYYANEVLEDASLPIRFCGFSPCYRSEIGSYGKDTKGLYRVHEFFKVEQVVLCRADTDAADRLHEEMIGISRSLHEKLGLPYRQLRICGGDLSAGKYKQYDLEAWLPGRNSYGETGSASNFLDWQSRRLNVRYRDANGEIKHVYMINNTAIPSPRFLIAILENYQNADGSVTIPEALRRFIPGEPEKIGPR
jgi:seryl-tRNA synthetase